MRFIGWLLDLLYPPRCVFCRKLLKDDETDICRKCRATVPMMDGAVKRGSFFKRCDSLYEYTGDVAASLKRYKFGGMRQYATVYGRQLAMLLLREGADFDVLTWAPISAKTAAPTRLRSDASACRSGGKGAWRFVCADAQKEAGQPRAIVTEKRRGKTRKCVECLLRGGA